MDEMLLGDLKTEVRKRRVQVIIGAGVSVASTAGSPKQKIASWAGLLEYGIDRCVQVVKDLPSAWADTLRAELKLGDIEGLLSVAERISYRLDAPSGGEYRRWLRDAFEDMKATNSSVLEALRDLQLPLATTNYDTLLEQITGLAPITWQDPGVERVLHGDDKRILHLHGYWGQPESVVLGTKSYSQLLGDGRAQAFLQAMRTVHTLLFVGFGGGLADPNFKSLLEWAREIFRESEYRHFRLCLLRELTSVQAQHDSAERLFALAYGEDYADLAPFLRSLVTGDASPRISSPQTTSDKSSGAAALSSYKTRMRFAFSRWDFSPVLATTRGMIRTVGASLDSMYLAPRFSGESLALGNSRQFSPEDIIQESNPLLIRGPGGSGKTTFMRWMFRRLLELDEAVPIMIVVRDLARYWSNAQTRGDHRSLDSYIRMGLAEHIGQSEDLWQELLVGRGPRPVLLIDGWDEMGPLGDELRSKLLGLWVQRPSVKLVASSRPHGLGQPSRSEGFDIYDMQPLAHQQIEELARRFFSFFLAGKDDDSQRTSVEDFMRDLNTSPSLSGLASNPLLLSMLLSISQTRPLPVKRHLLFEECVEGLLLLQQNRSEQGVLSDVDEWHPTDSEETLRVVAKLAYDMSWEWHSSGLGLAHGSEEVADMLPSTWPVLRRRAFLRWLYNSVGLLDESPNATLSFKHYSLQEFLVAWHLNAVVSETEHRIEFFTWGGNAGRGWETLRLWAAQIVRFNPASLEPILARLHEGGRACMILAGMFYADGLGSEESFATWIARAGQIHWIEHPWERDVDLIQAWAINRQEIRRNAMAQVLLEQAKDSTWPKWSRLKYIFGFGGFPAPPEPTDGLAAAFQARLRLTPRIEPSDTALERLLGGIVPAWPLDPGIVGLLHLWPARRRLIGFRLQLAALCGFDQTMLKALAGRLLSDITPSTTEALMLLKAEGQGLFTYSSEMWDYFRDWAAQELPGDWKTRRSLQLRMYWLDEYWRVVWYRSEGEPRLPVKTFEWVEWLWQHARDYPMLESMATDLKIEGPGTVVRDFALLDIASPSRSTARAYLAWRCLSSRLPEVLVLSSACRYSLHPDERHIFEQSLERYRADIYPLWAALACHIARQSTETDRAALIECAQSPERFEPSLAPGLQFYVAGDIKLGDGSILTLNELTDDLNLQRLPYLEEMPDDLPDLISYNQSQLKD